MENLGLRHNDWGELAVKLGRALKEEEFMKSALLQNQQNRMDIVLESNAIAEAIESFFADRPAALNVTLEGYMVQIKNYLAEYNSDFGSFCSIQKFTNLFKRCLPYLRRLYDVSEDNERREHRTRYYIRKK